MEEDKNETPEQQPNTDQGPTSENAAPDPVDKGYAPKLPLAELKAAVDKVRNGIQQVVIGQREMVDLLLIALLSDGHVLIEGVPGVAKTLTAKLLARTIATDFSRIQFTPDLMPSDVLGTYVFNQKSGEFDYHQGPIFSNIVLVDEINRAPAKTQSALFEVMEERQVTMEGETFAMSYPFLIVATQNPIDQEGTYRLPEAQLDRFLFKIEVGHPALEHEQEILKQYHDQGNKLALEAVKEVLSTEELQHARQLAAKVGCEAHLLDYIAKIVHATRNDKGIMLGASPRASLAILSSSKALAAMEGRDFVTPEDIRFTAPHVIKHRIILTPEREMEGVTSHTVVKELLERIEVPR